MAHQILEGLMRGFIYFNLFNVNIVKIYVILNQKTVET